MLFYMQIRTLILIVSIRFVLAATDHLQQKFTRVANRVRQLESAIACLHSKETHPLLVNNEYEDNSGSSTPDPRRQSPAKRVIEMQDAHGTLSIADDGHERFLGPSGGTELLLSVSFLKQANFPLTNIPSRLPPRR